MYEQNEAVQKMIGWLEEHLEQSEQKPVLWELSRAVGYSPWYCSALFHQICGMTLRSYVATNDY